jgi:alpha-1,6-mannosyltransferase
VPSLTSLRCSGLAAAVLLAVVGFLGGARPHADLAATPISIARGPYGPIILGGWLIGTAFLAYAWWSARDRVRSSLWAAPFLVVPPMGSRDVYSYACQGYLFVNGVNPYEHGVNALPCPAGVKLAGGSLLLLILFFRLLTLLGLAAVAAAVPVIARRCGIPRARARWIAMAGPLAGAHLLAAPHNDALMVGLLTAGLAVTTFGSPRCWLAGGLLIGLAVAIKVTAIVVVPFRVARRRLHPGRDRGTLAVLPPVVRQRPGPFREVPRRPDSDNPAGGPAHHPSAPPRGDVGPPSSPRRIGRDNRTRDRGRQHPAGRPPADRRRGWSRS